MLRMNIIIVGAGVAGLSTAIALCIKGHTVTVLERNGGLQTLGGALHLWANATRVIVSYGLEDLIEKSPESPNTFNSRRYDNGAVLSASTANTSVEKYGYPSWTVARYSLQEKLADAARARGAIIRFGTEAVSVDLGQPAVRLKDGSVLKTDLIIGAEGIRSVIRDEILGEAPIKSISHLSGYNIDIPRSLMRNRPSLSPFLTGTTAWLGPGQIIVTMNMFDHGDKFNACLVSEDEDGQEGEWHAHGDLDKVKAKFAHFEPRVKEFLDLARPEDCYIWRFADLPQLESWVSKSGKALIIGDAAHAMLPYSTMGASQCIESSACLAMCLDYAKSPSDLPRVLAAYEQIRKPRAEWMVRRGRETVKVWHLPDGEQQQQRDKYLATMSSSVTSEWDGKNVDDPPEGSFNPLIQPYMQGFDIINYNSTKLTDTMFPIRLNKEELEVTHVLGLVAYPFRIDLLRPPSLSGRLSKIKLRAIF